MGNNQVESFEDFFKSDAEEHSCPTCGGEVEIVEKGGMKKMKAKRGGQKGSVAQDIGNEKDPHKGGKTGTFVTNKPRAGSLGGATNRDKAAKDPHPPKTGVVKAMFPGTSRVQLVEYTGTQADEDLAEQISASQDPVATHKLFVPPARNMEMERESGNNEE